MKKYLLLLAATPGPLLLGSCFNPGNPGDCRLHCWEDRPEVEDANSNNRFDSQCTNFHTTPSAFFPPLPPLGFFVGRQCMDTQSEHDLVKGAIAAIKAEETLSMSQLNTYEDLVEKIVDGAWTECRTFLIGSPGFTDIDPNTSGNQACTPGTAEDLCDLYVRGPMLEALLELENCGIRQPMYSGADNAGSIGNCAFSPEFDATESVGETEMCEELPTTGAEIETFGDFRELVDCGTPSSCEIDEDIVLAVQTNFGTFYDEGVVMTVSTTCPGGAKITGLNVGEESYDLAAQLGIANNDVITEVNGIKLDSNENVSDVLLWLSEGQDAITLKRWRGTCGGGSSTTYNITVTTH